MFWVVLSCIHVFFSTWAFNEYLGLNYNPERNQVYPGGLFLDPMIAWNMALAVAMGVMTLLMMHLFYVKMNISSVEQEELAQRNPFRKRKFIDNWE